MACVWWLLCSALVVVICTILCKTSQTFRYYTKNTFFYTTVITVATLSCIYGWLQPRHPNNIRPICAGIRSTRWFLGLNVETRNGERLKSKTPYILVANHQSGLDMLCMSWILPDRCVAIIKREILFFAQFGLSAWLCGSIFIDRLNPQKSRKTISNAAQTIHDKNLKVWVFPEGTRGREDGMLPFKKGAFHLAVEAQIPIVPVVISTYRPFFRKKEKLFDSGKIIITALPPVSTEGKIHDDVTAMSESIREDMMQEYNKIKEEVENYSLSLNRDGIPNGKKSL